jgi:hypothetical protein
MSNIPYQSLINLTENFANNHMQIKRFRSDFLEQLSTWAGESDRFPILYMEPGSIVYSANTFSELASFQFTFYALDQIQKDRSNINTILNNTSQILGDLHKYMMQTLDASSGIDIIDSSIAVAINNYTMEYVAGWKMTLTFEAETYSYCNIPLLP